LQPPSSVTRQAVNAGQGHVSDPLNVPLQAAVL